MVTAATLPRPEWLQQRRLGIGASDVPPVCHIPGAYGSEWAVWAEKVGLLPLEEDDAPHLQFGRDAEPLIADWFTQRTGLHIIGQQRMVHHPRFSHHFATLDGKVAETPDAAEDSALGVYEAKTDARGWGSVVPPRVRAQVLWQLHVTQLEHAWVAALQFPFGHVRFDVHEIHLDRATRREQTALVRQVERFWTRHVVTGRAPFPDPGSGPAIDAAYGRTAPAREAVALDDLAPIIDKLAELKVVQGELKERRDRVEAVLKDRLGTRSEGTVAGFLRVSWRGSERDGGVDAARVRADHGDKYDRPRQVSRRLLLHDRRPGQ